MLSKENRLQKNKDFERVFKRSKTTSTRNLNLRAVFVSPQKETRVGFVVSNKVNKLAVRRNSLKRQMREVFRHLISSLAKGYDVVVTVRKDFPFPYDQKEIGEEIVFGLKKLGFSVNEKSIDKDN